MADHTLSFETALRMGDVEEVRRLAQAGADVNAHLSGLDMSPLVWAMNSLEDEDIFAALLEFGADPDKRDENGQTALMIASWNGRAPFVRRLIAAGADVNARDKGGQTPLMHAVQFNPDREVIALLIQADADPSILGALGMTASEQLGETEVELRSLFDGPARHSRRT